MAIKANTREFVGFILFISLLFLVGVYSTTGFGFPRQERGYYLAQWLNQQAEPDSIVGAWNSGIIGYFSQNPVINLDGVVNNDLYDYKITHQTSDVAELMDYIKTRQITYLTDYELIYFANPPEMGLKDAYESPEYGFRVYQLIGD